MIIIISIIAGAIFIRGFFDLISYQREIKRDRERDEKVTKIIELDEFERKLSDDPGLQPMHPKDWEAFGYANNINA